MTINSKAFSFLNMETKDKIAARMNKLGLKAADISRETGAGKGSVSQWLNGISKPGNKYLPQLAELLDCDAGWLVSEKPSFTDYVKFGEQLGENLVADVKDAVYGQKTRTRSKQIPLISWVTAGAWEEPVDNYSVGDAEDWLPCPPGCNENTTFALTVTGESMDDGSPQGYRDGEMIFVDGSQVDPIHNIDVVIKNGEGKVTFKRLVNSNGEWLLKPLNKNWPEKIIALDSAARIVGRVMFSGMKR